MFKNVTAAWNAHTPDYLHPHTKENLIWQLKLTAVLVVGLSVKSWWDERQYAKRFKNA